MGQVIRRQRLTQNSLWSDPRYHGLRNIHTQSFTYIHSPVIIIIIIIIIIISGSRDSSVGVATGYRLDGRGVGVRVPVGSRILSSPRRPDRLWGPPSLLSNAYRG
jgi:hypothetical protein